MVTLENVKKVAELARLKLTEDELTSLAEQLTKILKTFETISEVPTDGVEPLVTPVSIQASLREDSLLEHYDTEKLLENAPDKMGSLVRVPPVV